MRHSSQSVEPMLPTVLRKDVWVIEFDRPDILGQYEKYHGPCRDKGIGFFHLERWLAARDIPSRHRVVWRGVRYLKNWLASKLVMAMLPLIEKYGLESELWND